MYDYRTKRQAHSFDIVTGGSRTKIVHRVMDDRDRIKNGLEASAHSRDDLAQALGVSVPSLGRLLRKERRLSAGERDKAFSFLGFDDQHALRRLPIVGEITAGDWRTAVEEPLGYEWSSKGGPNTFVLKIRGDSMNMVAPADSRIAVDPDDRNLVSGALYAVMNGDGESTFKQFRTDPARLEPLSTNKRYHSILLGSDDFKVIGRVVQAITDY